MKKNAFIMMLAIAQSVCLYGSEMNLSMVKPSSNLEVSFERFNDPQDPVNEWEAFDADENLIAESAVVTSGTELVDAINFAAAHATGKIKIYISGEVIGNFVIPAMNFPIILVGRGDNATLNGNATGTTLTVDFGAMVKLKNLTITNGLFNDGAGILNNGYMKIHHCSISNNKSTADFGGIRSNGRMLLEDSSVSNNTAALFTGGVVNFGFMRIKKCSINSNTASGIGGVQNEGYMTIGKTSINDNAITVFSGGGIYNDNILIIRNSHIEGNTCETGAGGGITNNEGAMLTVKNTKIRHNSALFGGGIRNEIGAALTLDNTDITKNTATHGVGGGGGIFNQSAVPIIFLHSKVKNNTPDNIVPPL